MPRVRLGVVLLVRGTTAIEIDGLRRACGDPALARIAPHLTLVPPVNVQLDAVPRALAVLRSAAASTRPIELTLGPPATFAPVSPTLHLGVGGPASSLEALGRLREMVFRVPLERVLDHPFVPHVTIAESVEPDRLVAGLRALADYRVEVIFDRLHLLEERHGDSGRRWVPIADHAFVPRRIVGRGGLPIELTLSELVDPEAEVFERRVWSDEGREPPEISPPPTARMLVVTARREREGVVGLARGWIDVDRRDLGSIVVAAETRRQGVAGHLHAAFESFVWN